MPALELVRKADFVALDGEGIPLYPSVAGYDLAKRGKPTAGA